MNQFQMKRLTGIGAYLLFFLVFSTSAERCENKNDCTGDNEVFERAAMRDVRSQRHIEREPRMINIQGRVGSERLVNNRRIVDSDSRLSNFRELRNMGRENTDSIERNSKMLSVRNLQNRPEQLKKEREDERARRVDTTQRVSNLYTYKSHDRNYEQDKNTRRVNSKLERYQNSQTVRGSRVMPSSTERTNVWREVRTIQREVVERQNRNADSLRGTENIRSTKAETRVHQNRGNTEKLHSTVKSDHIRFGSEEGRSRDVEDVRDTRISNSRTTRQIIPVAKQRVVERNIPETETLLDHERTRNIRAWESRMTNDEANRNTPNNFLTKTERNLRINQNTDFDRTSHTGRFQIRDLEIVRVRTSERNTRAAERRNSAMDRHIPVADNDVRNERGRIRIANNDNVRNDQERREIVRLNIRDRNGIEKENTREQRTTLASIDERLEIREGSRVDQERKTNENHDRTLNNERSTVQSRRIFQAPNSIDENNNKIYRSYLNQEHNRIDTAWTKLLTTLAAILIMCQIVHSKLDSKRFYKIKNIFTAVKEKVA